MCAYCTLYRCVFGIGYDTGQLASVTGVCGPVLLMMQLECPLPTLGVVRLSRSTCGDLRPLMNGVQKKMLLPRQQQHGDMDFLACGSEW